MDPILKRIFSVTLHGAIQTEEFEGLDERNAAVVFQAFEYVIGRRVSIWPDAVVFEDEFLAVIRSGGHDLLGGFLAAVQRRVSKDWRVMIGFRIQCAYLSNI